jgi:hypothetical protein
MNPTRRSAASADIPYVTPTEVGFQVWDLGDPPGTEYAWDELTVADAFEEAVPMPKASIWPLRPAFDLRFFRRWLTGSGRLGVSYHLERSRIAGESEWQPYGSEVWGSGIPVIRFVPTGNPDSSFFRLIEKPPYDAS